MEEAESVTLQQLRRELKLYQQWVGDLMCVSRSRVAYIETHSIWDMNVKTVGSYIDTLGGRLELWVVKEDGQRVRLEIDRAG